MKSFFGLILTFFALSLPLTSFASTQRGEIPGVKGPYINFVDNKLQLTILLTEVELEGGIEVPIYKTKNSFASIQQNVIDGGSMVVLKIANEDIKELLNVEFGDSQTLPCGRPIPGIPGGVLKDAFRLDLPEEQYNLSFYYHPKLFGIYVPFNFEVPTGMISIPLKWKGKNVGAFALIGKDGDKKASGTVFLRLDAIKNDKEMQLLLGL